MLHAQTVDEAETRILPTQQVPLLLGALCASTARLHPDDLAEIQDALGPLWGVESELIQQVSQ